MTAGDAISEIKQVIFKSEPHGWVKPSDLEVTTVAFDVTGATLEENDVLVKALYVSVGECFCISLPCISFLFTCSRQPNRLTRTNRERSSSSSDPYMRGRLRVGAKSYTNSFTLNAPLDGGVVAKVVRSSNPKFPEGSVVVGHLPWKEYHIVPQAKGLTPVKSPAKEFPLSYFLGIAGMPGFTAYAGLLKIGKPKAGETLYVSAASGAVGLVVCQIGKAMGLKVVGSAGSDDKVNYLINEIGIEAFNYKTVNIEEALTKYCPDGIDIYFENVGGEMLDIVLTKMNMNGRIPVCGMISQYNTTAETAYGVKNLMNVIGKRLTFQGFIISDYYATETFGEFMRDIMSWIAEGKIVYRETVSEGIESLPEAFVGMLKGENFGKAVVRVASE
ncbi:hypothetical protein HDU67_007495 [Dinochytrium kinnereticum]|nr:hypothetical protein HDU67_007495 [Dinochytrium kinnereticum]